MIVVDLAASTRTNSLRPTTKSYDMKFWWCSAIIVATVGWLPGRQLLSLGHQNQFAPSFHSPRAAQPTSCPVRCSSLSVDSVNSSLSKTAAVRADPWHRRGSQGPSGRLHHSGERRAHHRALDRPNFPFDLQRTCPALMTVERQYPKYHPPKAGRPSRTWLPPLRPTRINQLRLSRPWHRDPYRGREISRGRWL